MHRSSKLNQNLFILNGTPVKVIHIIGGAVGLLLLIAICVAVG